MTVSSALTPRELNTLTDNVKWTLVIKIKIKENCLYNDPQSFIFIHEHFYGIVFLS